MPSQTRKPADVINQAIELFKTHLAPSPMDKALQLARQIAGEDVRADADKWITVHPHDGKGTPALIGENGEVKAGMGGKFNGKNIKDAHGTKNFTSGETNAETAARNQQKTLTPELGVNSIHAPEQTGNGGEVEVKTAGIKKSRLEVLENSLKKKEEKFSTGLESHWSDVKSANGQPLNDKRNGAATLNRWEKQNNSLHNTNEGIEKTKQAIEREKGKIANVAAFDVPIHIKEALDNGELTQWRKYPNRFFVSGVDKARIVVNEETGQVSHQYVSEIKDKEQYAKFRDIFNRLKNTPRVDAQPAAIKVRFKK